MCHMHSPCFAYMDGMKLYELQLNNVDMPNSIPYLNWILTFGVAPRTNTKKDNMFKRDWIASSKYDHHSRLNNQHI